MAGAAGIVLFPTPSLGVLAWFAFVPLLLLLRAADTRREAMLRGWLGGFGFLAATLYWLLPTVVYFFPLLAAALALLWLPWGVLVWALLRGDPPGRRLGWRRSLLAASAVPAGWVLIEAVRSWKWFGGPWSLLGTSQWNHPAELGLAAVGGVWLLSFAIMLTNTCIVLVLTARVPVKAAGAALAAVAVAAGPAYFATHSPPAPSQTLSVALVQPGVVHDPQARFDKGLELTRQLQGEDVDLVVWGESSGVDGLSADPAAQQQLRQLSTRLGAPLLVNADTFLPDGKMKVSFLYTGTGEHGEYAKSRLVMFGEYIPFRDQLQWLTGLTKAAKTDLLAGDEVTVFPAGGTMLGPLVCFESAFPDMARAEARHGAQLIVYQSADSSFQGSWEPAQHASLAAVRAAEAGRPALHATLTGESAAFDAQGRELAWLSKDTVGSTIAQVPIQAVDTPYDRYGQYVPVASLVIVVSAVGTLVIERRLRRPSSGGGAG